MSYIWRVCSKEGEGKGKSRGKPAIERGSKVLRYCCRTLTCRVPLAVCVEPGQGSSVSQAKRRYPYARSAAERPAGRRQAGEVFVDGFRIAKMCVVCLCACRGVFCVCVCESFFLCVVDGRSRKKRKLKYVARSWVLYCGASDINLVTSCLESLVFS